MHIFFKKRYACTPNSNALRDFSVCQSLEKREVTALHPKRRVPVPITLGRSVLSAAMLVLGAPSVSRREKEEPRPCPRSFWIEGRAQTQLGESGLQPQCATDLPRRRHDNPAHRACGAGFQRFKMQIRESTQHVLMSVSSMWQLTTLDLSHIWYSFQGRARKRRESKYST